MIALRRGDVVLVPFDFTNRLGVKWRPAVVVSTERYNHSTPDLLVASITGNVRAMSHPRDQILQDWQAAGLLKPSRVQTKLATIESSVVGRKLGSLTGSDLASLEAGLRESLGL